MVLSEMVDHSPMKIGNDRIILGGEIGLLWRFRSVDPHGLGRSVECINNFGRSKMELRHR